MELDIAARRPGVLHRARRPGAGHQARHRHHGHRARPRRVHRQRGRPARHPARPGLRHQQLGLPVLLAQRRRRPQPLSRFTVTGDTIDLASEERRARGRRPSATPAATPAAAWSSTRAGNLYLATGDNTNPFESDAFNPIDERPGRQDFDAQRTSGNTNDLRGKVLRIHPEADGTYTVPAGNLFPRRHRADPARDLRDGLPQPVPDRHRPGHRHALRRPTTARTRRPPNPNRGPRGHGRVEHRRRSPATTAGRTATATTTPTTTSRSRPARAGRSSTAPRRSTTRRTTPA